MLVTALMTISGIVACCTPGDDSRLPLLYSAFVTGLVGFYPLIFVRRGRHSLSFREGNSIVVIAWIWSWGHFCGRLVVLDGFGKVVEVDVSQSAQLIAVGKVGVAANGLVAVKDGARIIFKVELRHSPKEVRLIEVGLIVDDNVEVADGEHIVVIRKCVARNIHHAVSVDLGRSN